MLRQIYRSRAVRWIGVIGIALLLIAGVTAFARQGSSAHAQMPGQQLATHAHTSSTRGCSSVDGISNDGVDAALAQCGDAGNMFKATVVAWGANSTTIKAGLQGHGMPYMNRCAHFACSTAQFPANAGDTICYQGFAGTTQTDVECYTIPADSNGSTTPALKFQ
jgi:hypothetical protein